APVHPSAAGIAAGCSGLARGGGAVTAVLQVEDLVVEYHGQRTVRAVDGVSLSIAPSEVLALVGESGCGKSSTARAVVGMERPQAGAVRFRDRDVPPLGLRRRPAALTAIQMVFQDPNSSLNPRKRVGEQIADGLAAARSRAPTSDSPPQPLAAVRLPPRRGARRPHP